MGQSAVAVSYSFFLPEKTEKGEKRQYICLACRFFFVILQTHIISNMVYY